MKLKVIREIRHDQSSLEQYLAGHVQAEVRSAIFRAASHAKCRNAVKIISKSLQDIFESLSTTVLCRYDSILHFSKLQRRYQRL